MEVATPRPLQWGLRQSSGGNDCAVHQKASSNKNGWGNLPSKVLHMILSYANEDVEIPPVLSISWGNHSSAWNVTVKTLQKARLCRMRTVCLGWKKAVDSHPFWIEYATLIDPSRLQTIRRATSGGSQSSIAPFRIAKIWAFRACLACRLNRPTALSSAKLPSFPRFGPVLLCEEHINAVCYDCLAEPTHINDPAQPSRLHDASGHLDAAGLRACLPEDYNDLGRPRGVPALVCSSCRTAAVLKQVGFILTDCARGGPIRGIDLPWLAKEAIEKYIDERQGSSTARIAAYKAVERTWLDLNTEWADLAYVAEDWQTYINEARLAFIKTRQGETKENRAERHLHIRELFGDEEFGMRSCHEEDLDMLRMYAEWEVLADGDFEEIEDLETGAPNWDDYIAGPYVMDKLRQASIESFMTARIIAGLWVSPTDEVTEHLLSDERHLPWNAWHRVTKRPLAGLLQYRDTDTTRRAVSSYSGVMLYEHVAPHLPPPRHGGEDTFLPPPNLLRDLEASFQLQLQQRLLPAMREIVRWQVQELRNEEVAEKAMDEIELFALLRLLCKDEAWLRGCLIDAAWDAVDLDDEEMLPSDPGGPTVDSNEDTDSEDARSPVIERLEDEVIEADYGIREDLVSDDEESIVLIAPRLDDKDSSQDCRGKKRKSPPAEEEHRSSAITIPQEPAATQHSHPGLTEHALGQNRNDLSDRKDGRKRDPSTSPPFAPSSEETKSSSEASTGPVQPLTPEDSETASTDQDAQYGKVAAGTPVHQASQPQILSMSVTPPTPHLALLDKVASATTNAYANPTSAEEPHQNPTSTAKTATVSVSPPTIKLARPVVHPDLIPYVPLVDEYQLGAGGTEAVMQVWWDARAKLRVCNCTICERQRRDHLETFGWMFTAGGEGAKRTRLL